MPSPPPRKGLQLVKPRDSTSDAPELELDVRAEYEPGDVIASKYRLVRLIGEGGMGAVWLARNETLDAEVAIKLIRREVATAETADRLLQEAQLAAKIEHTSVVRIFDFGVTEYHDPFIVMELIKGESLDDVLDRKGKLSPEHAVQTMLPVASALVAAHRKGIVHRDLKPGNVVLTHGDRGAVIPKVVDFGIAKLRREENASVTGAGAVLGSPEYMSPEQARGKSDIDDRADIWAVAVVLYELLTGQRPFDGDNYNAILAAIIETEPASITSQGFGDEQLWSILERALAKERSARWPNMTAFGQALATWAVDRGVDTDVAGTSIALQWLGDGARRRLDEPPEAVTGRWRRSSLPGAPPVAQSAAPTDPRPVFVVPAQRATRTGTVVAVALAGAMGGAALLVAVWLFGGRARSVDSPPPTAATTAIAPAPPAAATAVEPLPATTASVAPVESSSPAAPVPTSSAATPDDVDACTVGTFAAGAFEDGSGFSWICSEADPRRGAAALKKRVVEGGARGKVTEAMKEWAMLHWYELAAFGVVRARCCAKPPALQLPAPIGSCRPLDRTIEGLAGAATSGGDVDAAVASFRAAVHCSVSSGTAADYTYKDRPPPGAEAALHKTLLRVAEGR